MNYLPIKKILLYILIVLSISLYAEEDIPVMELMTTLVQDYLQQSLTPKRGYVVDNILFFRNSTQNRILSLNLQNREKRTYEVREEIYRICGHVDHDLLIVRRIEETDIGDIYRPYLYDPENGTYTPFSVFDGLDSEDIPYELDSVFHLYDSVYIVVMIRDPNIYYSYIYNISTGDYELLKGMGAARVVAISPDRLTAIVGLDGLCWVYSLVEKRLLQPDIKKNYSQGEMYLTNDLFLSAYDGYNTYYIYDLDYNKHIQIRYLPPEDGPYNYYTDSKWELWGTNYIANTAKVEKESSGYSNTILEVHGFTEALDSLGLLFHPTTGTVNDNRVRVREWPLLDAKHLGFLNEGDELEILDRSGIQVKIDDMEDYWYKVRRISDGLEGWSYGYFIDLIEE